MAKNEEETLSYNIISGGTDFEGRFNCKGNLRIDGSFKGSLSVGGKLVVGQGGYLQGDVLCKEAEIEGKLDVSQLKVNEVLALKSTAIINGDIIADKLSIEQGAIFVGHCTMPCSKSAAKTIENNKE